jgi:hypothetical protein
MSTEIKAKSGNPESANRGGFARDMLLASVGAASLLRKNAGSALTEAAAIAGRMPQATSILIEGIGERSAAMIDELGARGNAFRWEFARLARELGKKASEATTSLASDVESRVQPVLRKFAETKIGLGIVVAKPKAKRAAGKKTARKAVKPVAKRTVRKARKAA